MNGRMNFRKTLLAAMASAAVFLTASGSVFAQGFNLSDLLSSFQDLPESVQQQLANQVLNQNDDEENGVSDDGNALPLGQEAINYVRVNSPGKQVKAASLGHPIPPGTIYPPPQPEDEPDFWDRVKEVVMDAFFEAFQDCTGIPIPTAKEAGE